MYRPTKYVSLGRIAHLTYLWASIFYVRRAFGGTLRSVGNNPNLCKVLPLWGNLAPLGEMLRSLLMECMLGLML
jgi:hypothetical protein